MSGRVWLPISAVVASAFAYAASFPPLEWFWLMPIALALLFWVLRGLSPGAALLAGFGHGLIAYTLCASWLWQLFHAMSLALFGILATFHLLFALLAAWAAQRMDASRQPWRFALLAGALWTLVEFTRGELFWLKFPWFGVGVSRGPHWLLPWLGVYGVTFLTVVGVLLVLAGGRARLAGVLALAGWAYAGMKPVPAPGEGEPGSLAVGAVQAEMRPLKTYLRLSEALPADCRFLIWPEYAYASDLTRNKRDYEAVLSFLAAQPETVLVLGAHTWTGEEGWHNTALTLNAQGVLGRHFKNHTVHFFDDGIPGTEAVPVRTPHGLVGTPVCFDCDFQDVVRRMTAAGAELIVAPTMDAEAWTARQHEQHARLFQLRAAENGRWLVVAATSGVTQIVDPHGRVISRLPLMAEGSVAGRVWRLEERTFFTRAGYAFPWLLPGLILGTLMGRRVGSPRDPREAPA